MSGTKVYKNIAREYARYFEYRFKSAVDVGDVKNKRIDGDPDEPNLDLYKCTQ